MDDIEAYLKIYRDKILSLKIVYIELENKDDAYIIFDTLNDRGKSLALADKIKSYIFRVLKTNHSDVNRDVDYWNEIQERINSVYENINIDDYIRYQWVSRNGYATETQVYEKLKKKIKETDKKTAEKYLKDLKNDLNYFLFINSPKRSIDFISSHDLPHIIEPLIALNNFKIKQTTPVLIAIFREYAKKNITIKNIKKFLIYIESFHFQFNAITSGRPSVFQNLYFNFAKDLSNESLKDKNVLFNKFSFDEKKMPTEESLINAFKNKIYMNKKQQDKKLIQYILKKFDKYHRNNGLAIDYDKMTIEHLIPQSKSSLYGDDIIGQLGNLILIDPTMQNKLDNKPLKDKIKILRDNNYDMYLLDYNSITEDDNENIKLINTRTEEMAKLAFLKIWQL